MPSSIDNYRSLIEQPWGRMFYELIFHQLNIDSDCQLNILDFGAGFCVTADYYAAKHNVTAIEPNEEMLNRRIKNNNYSLINGDVNYLDSINDNTYDVVICHNVLEYADNTDNIIKQLSRVLKPNGILSVVKHNLNGRIISNAVFNDDPRAGLQLLNNQYDNGDNMFGNRNTYSNEYLIDTLKNHHLSPVDTFGIRTFFALSSNNEIKYTDEWYSNMLVLEIKASTIEEFKRIAFFNHLIFRKFDSSNEL